MLGSEVGFGSGSGGFGAREVAASDLPVGSGIVMAMGDASDVLGRPIPVALAAEAFYPTAVVGTGGGAVRFLSEYGLGDRRAGGPVEGDLVEAALRAVGELADLAHESGAPLRLAIDDRRIADLVRSVAAETPGHGLPVEVVDHSSWQIARLFADLYDTPAAPEPSEVHWPLLVVGTDGSTNQLSGAWAWVGSEGQHG